MGTMKVKIRKETVLKSLFLRVLLYACLIIIFVILLYPLLPYIEKYNIIYLLYFIILFIGVLVVQYLIYALSLNEKPSYHNFKNAILRINPRNPINFLFPEFESVYKLHYNIDDRINATELNNIIDISIDESKALEIENEFEEFIKLNMSTLLEYDVVIKVKRKGKAIFDDMVNKLPELEKLVPLSDSEIIYNSSKIKDRNIIIFDDSIHHSRSAHDIINLVKKCGCKTIIFVCVIAQKESLKLLKKDYPDENSIVFLQYKTASEEDYRRFYADYMFGYLDRVNSSLERDHVRIKLKIDRLINKEEFIKLFEDKRNRVYEVKRIVGKENEYKISVECRWLYDSIKDNYIDKIKMDMVKVRFFIKLNPSNDNPLKGTTEINMSSVLVPIDFSINCSPSKSKVRQICALEKFQDADEEFKDMICIYCIIDSLNSDFIELFMRYFEMRLRILYKASIIENKSLNPLPTEIYPFMNKY